MKKQTPVIQKSTKSMSIETLSIPTKNNYHISAKILKPINSVNNTKFVVIGSATNVRSRFYLKIGKYLAENGYHTIIFDYYGIGDSLNISIRKIKCNMQDWGENDFNAVVKFIIENYDPEKLFYLAHSFGGQILGMIENPNVFDGIVFVACQSGYWRFYPKIYTLILWFLWAPITHLFGFFPSNLMHSGVKLPKNVSLQLLKWSKYKEYFFEDENVDVSRFPAINKPILWYSFSDDPWAPIEAIESLRKYYPNAPITDRRYSPEDLKRKSIGHFSFFKEESKIDLWREVLDFFNNF